MGLHNRFPIAQFVIDLVKEDNFEGFAMHYQSKKPDGLLHPSGDLGCEVEMCHTHDPDIGNKPLDLANKQTLLTGTLWHAFIQGAIEAGEWDGVEFKCETSMAPGLPKGWQGTADLLVGQFGDGKLSEAEWQLIDFKTIKGSNVPYIDMDKPKHGYHMQASAYYYAAQEMGYKLAPELCILYIPVSAQQYKTILPPFEQWCKPLPRPQVYGEMKRRSQILKAYKTALVSGATDDIQHLLPKKQEPIQKTRTRKGVLETVETHDWLVNYCNSPQCVCRVPETVISYDTPAENNPEMNGVL